MKAGKKQRKQQTKEKPLKLEKTQVYICVCVSRQMKKRFQEGKGDQLSQMLLISPIR